MTTPKNKLFGELITINTNSKLDADAKTTAKSEALRKYRGTVSGTVTDVYTNTSPDPTKKTQTVICLFLKNGKNNCFHEDFVSLQENPPTSTLSKPPIKLMFIEDTDGKTGGKKRRRKSRRQKKSNKRRTRSEKQLL
jgi:hypothetical protein